MPLHAQDLQLASIHEVSPKQCDFYRNNGFLVLPAPTAELAAELGGWTKEIKNLPHKPNAWLHYEEADSTGQRTLTTTESFADHHAGFDALFRGSPMIGLLHQLLGEEMNLFKEKINYKAPNTGGFKAHTDAPAYVTVADLGRIVTVMIAVDAQTVENGCLEVVAGSHKVEIPLGPDRCLDDAWCATQKWIPLHLTPGQFVFFDAHLAHRSAANTTTTGRAAIFATYNSRGTAEAGAGAKRTMYYADRRKMWPATADRDSGEDYAVGASIFGFATPMLSVDSATYTKMGL
ncbi:epoxidase subunit A [Mycena crocata]|nr:epoxidase subunit A [Mycena crocata]